MWLRPDRKAGRGVWPAALKLFSVLIYSPVVCFFIGAHEVAALGFWLLLYQDKSNSLRGN